MRTTVQPNPASSGPLDDIARVHRASTAEEPPPTPEVRCFHFPRLSGPPPSPHGHLAGQSFCLVGASSAEMILVQSAFEPEGKNSVPRE